MLLSLVLASALSAAPEPLAVARQTVDLHNACRKSHDTSVCTEAADAYRAYFALGTTDPRDASLRFFFGELLYDQFGLHAEAKQQYELSLKLDPTGKYAQLSAYNAVLAADQLLRRARAEGSLPEPTIRDLKESLAIPPLAVALVEACDRYRARFSDSERLPEVSYRAAKVFYDHNHIEAAVARFSAIAEQFPKSQFENGDAMGELAANLVLDVYNLNQDWVQLLGWARRFHARAELGSPRFRDDLVRMIASTEIKLRRLKGRAAGALLRTFLGQLSEPDSRERLLQEAARLDGDFGPLADLRVARLDEDASLGSVQLAADTLERAGRAEEAQALRSWQAWLRDYEIAAEPPAERGCEEVCAFDFVE